MHYYTFNVGDYRKDTGHLSTLEHGIYRQLIDWYFLDEKPIPKETQTVMRRLRLVSDSDLQALQNVLSDFFILEDDGYHQGRCDAAIREYHARADKNKANGKRGGRPKKTQSVILGNPDESQPEGNQEPINPKTHKPNSSSLCSEEAPAKRAPVTKPVDVSDEVWLSFKTVRKAKKAAVTDLAILGIRREAVKAGISLNEALTVCCERGWAGFKAEWYAKDGSIAAKPQGESFYEREQRAKQQRWAEMTGKPFPTDGPTVIDVTPSTKEITHEPTH